MRRIVFICALVITAAALAVDTAPYFPMAIGHRWVNQDSTAEGIDTVRTTVTGTTMIEGRSTFICEKNTATPETLLYQIRTDGCYNMFNMYVEMAGLSITNVPVKFLKNPITVGESWVALVIDTNVVIMGFPVAIDIQVDAVFEGYEEVFVPMGNFRDCLKIVATATWKIDAGVMFSDSGVDVYSESYFAEHVGPVLQREYDIVGSITGGGTGATTSQLISYNFTNIEDAPVVPELCALSAFPNPFNSEVNIGLRSGKISSIEIYDLGGRLVESLGPASEGLVKWSPSNSVNSGVYLIKARSGSAEYSTRALYIK